MPRRRNKGQNKSPCERISQADAFKRFAVHVGGVQSAKHIKPLHWYIACRLVIEGGFHPDEITPRPPFEVQQKGRRNILSYKPELAKSGEQVILGGLKTKNVDVVVTLPEIGPVLAVSCKGVTKAFRNLTNRMEETIGECTNLHITYAAMVVGYFALLRANRDLEDAIEGHEMGDDEDESEAGSDDSGEEEGEEDDASPSPPEEVAVDPATGLSARKAAQMKKNDIAVEGDQVVDGIRRFHNALEQMTLRHGLREDIARYEAMALAIVEPKGDGAGSVFPHFPPASSALHIDKFFKTLYQRYEERFVYGAPVLAKHGITNRLEWSPTSPLIQELEKKNEDLGYVPRVAAK